MAQYGFYVDTDICTGCKACMTACFERNDLAVPEKFRKVYEFGGGSWEQDAAGAFSSTAFTYYVSMTCGQCEEPACVRACPTHAMRKDPATGIVDNDKGLCVGCMACERACPYGPPVRLARDGRAHKCTLCRDESADGAPRPSCVRACPVHAIEFGLIDELRAAHGEACALGELVGATGPNVVFRPHRDAGKGGTLRNPLEVGHTA